jgi:hypothetical protein
MFTKAESAQPYIYSTFTPAGNCWVKSISRKLITRGSISQASLP